MSSCAEAASVLDGAKNVLIVMHMFPDGDTTGSALGLQAALKQRGKEVTVVCQDPVPPRFDFMPNVLSVLPWDKVLGQTFDVTATVDCGDDSRVGDVDSLYKSSPTILNIDHHRSNRLFGTVNWVDPDESATGSMIVQLFEWWNEAIPEEAAIPLYVAISTDTGSFRQINTGFETFKRVLALSASKMDIAQLNERLWENQTWSEVQLLGWALSHIRRSDTKHVAWLAVSREVMARVQVSDDEVETLINHLRAIHGINIAIVTKEAPTSELIKVSWRGKRGFDVSQLASQFGGGGHAYSAAAIVKGSLEGVTREVLGALEVDI